METNNTEQHIKTVESDLAHLKELVAINKAALNTLQMDSRSMTTTIQNTVLSFGGLREKVEAVSETVSSIAEISESRLDKVLEIQRDKMTDFKCLCESRVSGIYAKIEAVKKEVDLQAANGGQRLSTFSEDAEKRLVRLENIVNRAAWGIFLTLVGYLLKIVVAQLGLPPISP